MCQKLLHFQLNNYADVLRWLRSLMQARKSFLLQNKKYATYGANEQISKQAAVKLEVSFNLLQSSKFYIASLAFRCITILVNMSLVFGCKEKVIKVHE